MLGALEKSQSLRNSSTHVPLTSNPIGGILAWLKHFSFLDLWEFNILEVALAANRVGGICLPLLCQSLQFSVDALVLSFSAQMNEHFVYETLVEKKSLSNLKFYHQPGG